MAEFELQTFDGESISLNAKQAHQIAQIAGLIEVSNPPFTDYINPKSIASIRMTDGNRQAVLQEDWKNTLKERAKLEQPHYPSQSYLRETSSSS